MVTLSLRLRPSLRVSLTCMWVLPVFILFGQVLVVVRARGVEPPRLGALEPKSSASASSATPAQGPAGRVGARVYPKKSGQSKPHWQAGGAADWKPSAHNLRSEERRVGKEGTAREARQRDMRTE